MEGKNGYIPAREAVEELLSRDTTEMPDKEREAWENGKVVLQDALRMVSEDVMLTQGHVHGLANDVLNFGRHLLDPSIKKPGSAAILAKAINSIKVSGC